jgi:signal transduction histidine kinase
LGWGEATGGFGLLVSVMAIAVAVRYQARAREQAFEQVKLREREQLARYLHDTVAHHVSAIAIQAQAGLVTATKDHDSAVDALRLIASEASRTLAEMRSMVRLLRSASSPELVPIPAVSDLELLAHPLSDGPSVDVEVSGAVDELSPAVSAAVYRLAQESITNARRHAHEVTRIEVLVVADEASVRLRVSDDGVDGRPRAQAMTGSPRLVTPAVNYSS